MNPCDVLSASMMEEVGAKLRCVRPLDEDLAHHGFGPEEAFSERLLQAEGEGDWDPLPRYLHYESLRNPATGMPIYNDEEGIKHCYYAIRAKMDRTKPPPEPFLSWKHVQAAWWEYVDNNGDPMLESVRPDQLSAIR